MGTPNDAARNEAANDFAADYAAAQLILLNGTTPLAVHTVAGFGAAGASVVGRVDANAIADATILAAAGAGTLVDGAQLVAGSLEWDLTVSTVAAGTGEVQIDDLNYVANGTSSVNSFRVQF